MLLCLVYSIYVDSFACRHLVHVAFSMCDDDVDN